MNPKTVVIAVIGGTVLLLGIAMIVLPGPAIVVIPLGLAILATEFVWAKKLLRKMKDQLPKSARKRFTRFWRR
ncbi:MAG TPA: PGPGW domain-containing protein [Candidatus Nanoarchaeia archaeon]|nr:PGPGW domain-containing protein [Candidatus Nanoarchaeia archaeon]